MYKEARDLFSTADTRMVRVIEKQMKSVAADRFEHLPPDLEGLFKHQYRWVPTKSIPATIVLDALEYAKGDWQRSLQYVDLSLKADPGNANLREARAYLEGLSAER